MQKESFAFVVDRRVAQCAIISCYGCHSCHGIKRAKFLQVISFRCVKDDSRSVDSLTFDSLFEKCYASFSVTSATVFFEFFHLEINRGLNYLCEWFLTQGDKV